MQSRHCFEEALGDIELLIPAPVMGELYFGAYNSGRIAHNITQLEQFLSRNEVIHCTLETGKAYGMVKLELKKIGRPIPENDIWSAAIAIQHGLALVTRDAHFKFVDNLILEHW